jgi:triosephosphate isomerase
MLKDCGGKFVILGHSECRKYACDTDEIVNKKIKMALGQKLTPIFCIGESQELRQKNNYFDFIKNQIENGIPKNTNIKELIIAYEPVWSIGTGIVPSIAQIEEMAEFIKKTITENKDLKIKNYQILYGGSTNKENSKEIINAKNIDGLLVGGASLNADEFFEIIKLAA